MALFRQNLNSGMNFLRRHFSSDDLYQDRDDEALTPGSSHSSASSSTYRMNLPGRRPLPTGPSFPTLSSVQDMTRGFLSPAMLRAPSLPDQDLKPPDEDPRDRRYHNWTFLQCKLPSKTLQTSRIAQQRSFIGN